MFKKFVKFLLFVSALGAVFAGAFYYMKRKESDTSDTDDYDDLDDDSYEVDSEAGSERSYVSLNHEQEAVKSASEADSSKKDATSGVAVEEFFDDDDDGSMDAI